METKHAPRNRRAICRAKPRTRRRGRRPHEPGISRNDTITLVARLWAQTNVNNALAWAKKLPDGYTKASALDAIRYVWVHSDPVAASKHVEKLPPGTTKNNLILNIAFEWAARDPSATIQWVNSLPDGRDKDEALAGIAESWANQGPAGGLRFRIEPPARGSAFASGRDGGLPLGQTKSPRSRRVGLELR